MAWPDHYPDSCPPSDAQTPAGRYFRLAESDVLGPGFLRSQWERMPERRFDDACMARGLSLYASAEEARRLQRRFPLMSTWRLVSADMGGAEGVMKPTPSVSEKSHNTWWLPEEADRDTEWRRFTLVEDV